MRSSPYIPAAAYNLCANFMRHLLSFGMRGSRLISVPAHGRAPEGLSREPDRDDQQQKYPAGDPEEVERGEQRRLVRQHGSQRGEGLRGIESGAAKLTERVMHGCRIACDAPHELRVMHGFAPLPESGHERGAEAARRRAEEIRESGAE